MTKSSQKSRHQVLGVIPAERAERMLVEWVNTDLADLYGDAHAWERLFRRYPEIPSVPVSDIIPFVELAKFDRFHQQMEMAGEVANLLQDAWNAPDLRRFEWYTWRAQEEYEWEAAQAKHNVTPIHVMESKEESQRNQPRIAAAMAEAAAPPATITPVEAAIFHLRRSRNRALHCPNPNCPAPYFFVSKKGQKFCSPECAKPSQQESKRCWWRDNRAKERKP